MSVSMSCKGDCRENAPLETERCWVSWKTELIHHCRLAKREKATRAVTEYIEVFHNRIRKQARLGFLSPAAFRQEYLAARLVA